MLLSEAKEILKSNGYVLNEAIKKEFQPWVNRITSFCDENGIVYDYGDGKADKRLLYYKANKLKQFKDKIELYYQNRRIGFFSLRPKGNSYKPTFTCNVYTPFIDSNATECSFGLKNEGTETIANIDEWESTLLNTVHNIDRFAKVSENVRLKLEVWADGE